jgi:malate:Na+ symporter
MAGLLPKNMIGGLAVIMTLGFALAKIGRMVPVLKDIGGPAILCSDDAVGAGLFRGV